MIFRGSKMDPLFGWGVIFCQKRRFFKKSDFWDFWSFFEIFSFFFIWPDELLAFFCRFFRFFKKCQKSQKWPILRGGKGAPLLIFAIFDVFLHLSTPKMTVFFMFFHVLKLPPSAPYFLALNITKTDFFEILSKTCPFLTCAQKCHFCHFGRFWVDFWPSFFTLLPFSIFPSCFRGGFLSAQFFCRKNAIFFRFFCHFWALFVSKKRDFLTPFFTILSPFSNVFMKSNYIKKGSISVRMVSFLGWHFWTIFWHIFLTFFGIFVIF